MTKFVQKQIACSVCGQINAYSVLASTNTIGYPDLDTRPGPLERDAMLHIVQQCPACGYCSTDIGECSEQAAAVVSEDRYLTALSDPNLPILARLWLCSSYIEEAEHQLRNAGWSALTAAWVCDDEGQREAAAFFRKHALKLFNRCRRHGTAFAADREVEHLVLADLFRRSRNFDAVATMCDEVSGTRLSEHHKRILDFQRQLAGAKDDACYSCEVVLGQDKQQTESLDPEEQRLVYYVCAFFLHLMTEEERSTTIRCSYRSDEVRAICHRVAAEHSAEVYANRCPSCGRLPRTVRITRCDWCGHVWRNAE